MRQTTTSDLLSSTNEPVSAFSLAFNTGTLSSLLLFFESCRWLSILTAARCYLALLLGLGPGLLSPARNRPDDDGGTHVVGAIETL